MWQPWCAFSPDPGLATLPARSLPWTAVWSCERGTTSAGLQGNPTLGGAMSEAVEAKVREIIINELGVEPEKVTDDASFVEDLGADSLDTVELVMAFEEEFGIDIPDEDAEQMRTVGDAIQYLRK